MFSLSWVLAIMFAVTTWLGRRSERFREQGLCQRCGRRPPSVNRVDLFDEIRICEPCSHAVVPVSGKTAVVMMAFLSIGGGGIMGDAVCRLSPECQAFWPVRLVAILAGIVILGTTCWLLAPRKRAQAAKKG